MPVALIPSFLFYCLVSGITPGPANLCSLSAALRYGKKDALKQWRGIFTGFAIVSLISVFVTYIFGTVFQNHIGAFSYVGAAYIIYLAIHILIPKKTVEGQETKKDCNFFTGLLVQLTNVKIMIFCLTALASFVLPYTESLWGLLFVGVLLPFTGPICNLTWIYAGVSLQKLFQNHEKLINVMMSVSLVLCAVSLVWR